MDRSEANGLIQSAVKPLGTLVRQLQRHVPHLDAVTSFGWSLLDDADASAVLSTLGVSTYIKTLLDDANAAAAIATLGAVASPTSGYAARGSPAFATTYQPSTTRPTHVIANVTIDIDAGEEGRVNVKVGSASPPTTVVALLDHYHATGRSIVAAPISFLVPAGFYYRIETQNVALTPSFGITSFMEMTL